MVQNDKEQTECEIYEMWGITKCDRIVAAFREAVDCL